jgi:DNA-binding transcriptional ArsR family regulator
MKEGQDQAHPERTGAAPGPDQPPAAVGTPGNPLRLTDARMMRALAHPARIAIWQFLGLDGPATATECAAVALLSPSACSYHLRTLSKYGIVEEDLASSTDGRERPWRVKVTAIAVDDGDASPATREASRLLGASAAASAEEVRESYRDRESLYPADWRRALGSSYDVLHVTPEELETLHRRMTELLGEYRRLDRDERPPGAGRVQVIVDLAPWFPPPFEQEDADQPE